jgi:hypothetical protein
MLFTAAMIGLRWQEKQAEQKNVLLQRYEL